MFGELAALPHAQWNGLRRFLKMTSFQQILKFQYFSRLTPPALTAFRRLCTPCATINVESQPISKKFQCDIDYSVSEVL